MKDSMTKRIARWGVLAVIGLGAGVGCAMSHEHHDHDGNEHDEKIALTSVPPAVVAGVKSAMPTGEITDAEKELKDGKTIYELDVKVGAEEYEVKVAEDGKIISKEDKEADEEDKK